MSVDVARIYVAARDEARRDGRPPIELAVEMARDVEVVRSMLDRLGGCAVFAATLLGHELEERSNRFVVTVRVDGQDPERLRTDRLDTPQGAAMARRVRRYRLHRVLVFKLIERTDDGAKGVRVLAWLEPIEQVPTVSSDAVPPAADEEAQGAPAEGSVVPSLPARRPAPSTNGGYDPGPAPESRTGVNRADVTPQAIDRRRLAAGLSWADLFRPVAVWAAERDEGPLTRPSDLATCAPVVLGWVDAVLAAAEADR